MPGRFAGRYGRLYTVAGWAVPLILWAAAHWIFGGFVVPAPWQTVRDAAQLLGGAHAWLQIGITLARVLAGFAVALLAGAAAGLAAGSLPALEALLRPVIVLLQGMPPLVWAIPLILVFGVGHLSPILVITLICFPLITLNVAEGLRSVPQTLEEMLRLLAPGPAARLRELLLPHLRPFLLASVQLGVVLGIKASAVAEYFGAQDGIGFQLQAAYQAFQVRRLFAWGLLLVLLIVALSRLLRSWPAVRRAAGGAASPGELPAVGGAAPPPASGPAASPVVGRHGVGRLRVLEAGGGSASPDRLLQLSGRPAPGGEEPSIRLEGVCFGYPNGPELLSGVSLRVEAGQTAVISGDSGAGKTTLLHLMASLLVPSSGMVHCPGRIGMVFQDDRLLPWRTNLYNAALPLLYGKRPAPAGRRERLELARFLLRLAGLEGLGDGAPSELSGGMKKRLGFARCFARLPGAVFLDEPFSGLDWEARQGLWETLFALVQPWRVPVVVVTHFPEEVPPGAGRLRYTLRRRRRGGPAGLVPIPASELP